MGQFDPVKEILDPDLWIKNQKLKPEVRLTILKRLQEVTSILPVKFSAIVFLGSMTRFQYKESSDIDIQVILSPLYDDDKDFWHQVFKSTNGVLLEGTLHPIYFHVLTSEVASHFTGESLVSAYDLITDKWIKRPQKPTYAELHKFDIDEPVFTLEAKELGRQIKQHVERPSKAELKDIADIFRRWDLARKSGYHHPGARGGIRTFANAMYKYLEKIFGHQPEKAYHKYYDPIRKMRERL